MQADSDGRASAPGTEEEASPTDVQDISRSSSGAASDLSVSRKFLGLLSSQAQDQTLSICDSPEVCDLPRGRSVDSSSTLQ